MSSTESTKAEEIKKQYRCAQQATKDFIWAFVAFALLLAESIFVDPIAVTGVNWSFIDAVDATTSSGSLTVGVVLFLKGARNIHCSIGDNS
jgi:hypothetical protein